MEPKDYLESENARNKNSAGLFTALVQHAYGRNNSVLVGHHICFEKDGQLETENEIPAADTLIFCHNLMTEVFGVQAMEIMAELARLPSEKREEYLREEYDKLIQGE